MAAVLLLLAIALPRPGGALVAVVATGLLRWGARVPTLVIVRSAAVPFLFLVMTCIAVVPSLAVSASGVRVDGWDVGAGITALQRGAGGVMAMLLLALTTRVPDLVRLLRTVGVPVAVCELGLAMYRMVWVLLDEQRRAVMALSLRGGALGWRSRWRTVVLLAVTLLSRAMRRARRLDLGERLRAPHGLLAARPIHAPLRAAGVVGALAWATLPVAGTLLLRSVR